MNCPRACVGAASDILPTLRAMPHLGALLGCYALLLNLAFAALPIPVWLFPQDTAVADTEGAWTFDPLASLCRFSADSGASDERAGGESSGDDLPETAALACAKCCAPALALALAAASNPNAAWPRPHFSHAEPAQAALPPDGHMGDPIRAPPALG